MNSTALAQAIAMMFLASSLTNCASLKVDRVPATAFAPPSTGQLSYSLPKTVITVVGTVTLNDCDSMVTNRLFFERRRS